MQLQCCKPVAGFLSMLVFVLGESEKSPLSHLPTSSLKCCGLIAGIAGKTTNYLVSYKITSQERISAPVLVQSSRDVQDVRGKEDKKCKYLKSSVLSELRAITRRLVLTSGRNAFAKPEMARRQSKDLHLCWVQDPLSPMC